MATSYTTRDDITRRLEELVEQKVILYAPIFAPDSEIGLFGQLKRADSGRWRVMLGFNDQAMALLFSVGAIERIAYPDDSDSMKYPQIQLRRMPLSHGQYEEFT